MWGWWWRRTDPRESLRRDLLALRDAAFGLLAERGKPRGLRWVRLDWHDDLVLVRDRDTAHRLALCPITVHFEAIEGGDMAGIEAVGIPRLATVVFLYERERWHATETVFFNLTPEEIVTRSAGRYRREAGDSGAAK
jgi:hypothetical protein